MKYIFRIDEKSLFYGIWNDFIKGQTATVHTPLNQSKDPEKWRKDIYAFIDNNGGVDVKGLPAALIDKCTKNTTSKAPTNLVKFYEFSKFALDGQPFEANTSFAFFVKEEIGKTIIKRNGKHSENTHYGRKKLHYPLSFAHVTDGFNINNKAVLNKILEVNGGFAFVVRGFDVDTATNTLNFKTIMVGPQGVPLSNVFKRKKGVGIKLLVDNPSQDESFVISTKNLSKEENAAFVDTLQKIQETSRKNGFEGEKYVFDHLDDFFDSKPVEKEHISQKFPASPYDIECIVNGEKKYIEVKSTQDSKKCFYMSKGERRFMDKYRMNYLLILVTNVKSDRKKTIKYERGYIMDSLKMEQEYQDIKFIDKK